MSSNGLQQANVLHLYDFNFEAVSRYFQLQPNQTAATNAMRFVYMKACKDEIKKGKSRSEACREAAKATIEEVEFRYNLLSFLDDYLEKGPKDPSNKDIIITATIVGGYFEHMSSKKDQTQFFDKKLIRDVKIINEETSEIMNGSYGDFWAYSMFYANIRSFEVLKQFEANMHTFSSHTLVDAHETLGIIKPIADKRTDIGKHLRACRSALKKDLDERASAHASTAQNASPEVQVEVFANNIIAVPYPLTRKSLRPPEPC